MGLYYSRDLCIALLSATAISVGMDFYVGRSSISTYYSPQGVYMTRFHFNPNVVGFATGLGALWQSQEAVAFAKRTGVAAPVAARVFLIGSKALACGALTIAALAGVNGKLRIA